MNYTEAQIEAAAKAIAATEGYYRIEEGTPERYRTYMAQARAALAAAEEAGEDRESCDAEIHSWERYRPEQIDSYWIRCTLVGPHDEHEDSNTGLRWLPVEGSE